MMIAIAAITATAMMTMTLAMIETLGLLVGELVDVLVGVLVDELEDDVILQRGRVQLGQQHRVSQLWQQH